MNGRYFYCPFRMVTSSISRPLHVYRLPISCTVPPISCLAVRLIRHFRVESAARSCRWQNDAVTSRWRCCQVEFQKINLVRPLFSYPNSSKGCIYNLLIAKIFHYSKYFVILNIINFYTLVFVGLVCCLGLMLYSVLCHFNIIYR